MKLSDFDRHVRDLVRGVLYRGYKQRMLHDELVDDVCQILLDNTELPATECSDNAYKIVEEYIAGAEAAERELRAWEGS